MTNQGRRLILMRHAKAEAFAVDDHARTLTERGRRDAVEAGLWLSANDLVPDHAVVSSAARTVGTWDSLDHGLRSTAEVRYEDALYSAGPATALDVVRTVPVDARIVVVIGHNPTVAYLAHTLDDGEPDEDAFREMSEGYPTAALTVLEVPVQWADLAEGNAHIAAFHVGHGASAV